MIQELPSAHRILRRLLSRLDLGRPFRSHDRVVCRPLPAGLTGSAVSSASWPTPMSALGDCSPSDATAPSQLRRGGSVCVREWVASPDYCFDQFTGRPA